MESPQPSAIILTGRCQSGKTTLLFALLHYLRRERLKVAGIIAEGLWENGVRSGFNLLDLSDGVFTPLCRRVAVDGPRQATPYVFFQQGMAAGEKALTIERCADADVVIVDEVGPLEIRGEGWAPCLSRLLELRGPVHLWVVRSKLLDAVRSAWRLEAARIVSIEEPDALNRLKIVCLGGLKKAQQEI